MLRCVFRHLLLEANGLYCTYLVFHRFLTHVENLFKETLFISQSLACTEPAYPESTPKVHRNIFGSFSKFFQVHSFTSGNIMENDNFVIILGQKKLKLVNKTHGMHLYLLNYSIKNLSRNNFRFFPIMKFLRKFVHFPAQNSYLIFFPISYQSIFCRQLAVTLMYRNSDN